VTDEANSLTGLEPIEPHLRDAPGHDPDADLVVRGWPLTIDGLFSNADATRSRFTFAGAPLAAISAEVTAPGWSLDEILAGPRLRTRSRYATATVGLLLDDGLHCCPPSSLLTSAWCSTRTLRSERNGCSICSERSARTRTTSGGERER
jgi:hypothetical protein